MVNFDHDLYDLHVKLGARTAIIHTTAKHPVWDLSKHAWVTAAHLPVGDQLLTPGGVAVADGGVTPVAHDGYMWDLTVDGIHDFYVASGTTTLLVHNCDEGSTEPGNRGAKASGRKYDSEAEARRAAEKYAKDNKSCEFRGLCSKGNHFHVDKSLNGRVIHVRHYYFP